MNAVEIEEPYRRWPERPSTRRVPVRLPAAFDNKETTIRRLRSRSANASDVAGGVLQRSNIHIAVCEEGHVGQTLRSLRENPKTATAKAEFILATDGVALEAEDPGSGETPPATTRNSPITSRSS